jgi:quinoprotein dehydrogenase-associated probable ABC transporter substrate-binding protein
MVCWDAGTPTTSTSDATVTLRTLVAALSGAAAYFTLGQLALAQQSPDLVSQTELRVCADPHNLPFSNQQGEGFENKIAELIAHDLNLKLSYTWYPDSQGFVRATLMKNRCDVIIGTVAGVEDMATTDAYYHTGYVMLTRQADNITTDKVSDWKIAGRRFGLIAATPPTNLIIQHNLMDQTGIYPLIVDTRVDQPGHTMVQDVGKGRVDVGLLWGPIAGFYAKHDHLPLRVTFLNPEDSKVRLDYHIAMGVRPGDIAFRRRLNAVIAKDEKQITQILRDYNVPLLDEQNRPLPPDKLAAPTQ